MGEQSFLPKQILRQFSPSEPKPLRIETIGALFDKLLSELQDLKELVGRSEDGRRAAIVYTEVEQAQAYYEKYFQP